MSIRLHEEQRQQYMADLRVKIADAESKGEGSFSVCKQRKKLLASAERHGMDVAPPYQPWIVPVAS